MKSVASAAAPEAVCYILPQYSQDESSHYAHVPALLSEISRYCTVYAIVERGYGEPKIPGVRVIVQRRHRWRAARMLELARLVWRLYRQGCRRFFVRISATAGLVLALMGTVLPIKVY